MHESAEIGLMRLASNTPKCAALFLAWLGVGLLAARCLAAAEPAGTLAEETPFATPYYVQVSGREGPTVMIVGGMHGNEPAGAYAAEQIKHWPIVRGKVIVVPRANVKALAANTRNTPGVNGELGNLNRNFASAAAAGPARGELAAALWALVESQRPLWLLDLHEGYDFNQINPKSVGSSLIVHPSPDADEVARLMLDAVNADIADEQKQFKRRGPPVDTSLARAAAEHLEVRAMILETTSKDQPLSLRARQHRVMVHRFFQHVNMLDPAVTPDWLVERSVGAPASAGRLAAPDKAGTPTVDRLQPLSPVVHDRSTADERTRVALYDSGGSTGAGIPRVLEQLEGTARAVEVVRVGPPEIRGGALSQFHVVMFTGGSGSRQANALGEEGRSAVRQFVEQGGGYVGICAGSYLACDGFSWGLKVLDAKTVSPKWQRGIGMVRMELTDKGREIFGPRLEPFEVKYHNGPIIAPNASDLLPDYEPLALFRSELAENGSPKGVMLDSPAIVAGECGKGRVLCIGPHPEQTAGLEEFVPRAVRWVSQRHKGCSGSPD
jgi:glutamine amidotransferase-like uncharacterized protein